MKLPSVIFDRIMGILTFLAGILVVLMMLGVSAEVVSRYFFDRPLTGVIEVSEIIILWVVFLGAAWLLEKDGHVKMEIIVKRLKPGAQVVLSVITSIIGAFISLVFVWYGTTVTLKTFHSHIFEAGIPEISSGVVLVIIPIGSLLLFIQFLRRAYGYGRGTAKSVPTIDE